MAHRAVRLRVGSAEDFQRLVLGRGGKREVAGVGEQPARLHQPVDPVLEGFFLTRYGRRAVFRERLGHGRVGAAALAGVRLVDDDGEAPAAMLVADLVQDERELLHRGDDDLLAAFDEAAQVAGALGVADGGPDLRVLADGAADLPVQDAAVGDYDDRVEHRGAAAGQADQLVGQPGDGVALAAAGGVLDQVAPARAVYGGVGEQAAHHFELMVARPNLGAVGAPGLGVLEGHHLGVVLQDVGEAAALQHLPPQVVDRQSVRIGRVAGAVVPAAVEGQEPRSLAGQVGAETHLALVGGEVRHATAKRKEPLARVAVAPVLQHRVGHGLLGQVVLQLEGEDRQPVDEQPQVERPLRLAAAVAELAGDGKAVLLEPCLRRPVAGRRRAIEQVQAPRAVLDAAAQHVDGAALGDFVLQPGQEAQPHGTVLPQLERLGRRRLCVPQKGGELHQVYAVLAVVVVEVARAPTRRAVPGLRLADGPLRRRVARLPGQPDADQPLQPPLRSIGNAAHPPSQPTTSSLTASINLGVPSTCCS